MKPYVKPALLVVAHAVKGVRAHEVLVWISDQLAGTVEASWLAGAPFRAIRILFVFDEDCPPLEIVTIDEARERELFVRCARSSADVRAAQRAKRLLHFFYTDVKAALAAVAEKYALPPLALPELSALPA